MGEEMFRSSVGGEWVSGVGGGFQVGGGGWGVCSGGYFQVEVQWGGSMGGGERRDKR